MFFIACQSEDVYDNALNSSYTGWNLQNRKILLIFLSNLQEPVFVGVPELLTIDYQFFGKVKVYGEIFSNDYYYLCI
jgi:hypothetical protein